MQIEFTNLIQDNKCRGKHPLLTKSKDLQTLLWYFKAVALCCMLNHDNNIEDVSNKERKYLQLLYISLGLVGDPNDSADEVLLDLKEDFDLRKFIEDIKADFTKETSMLFLCEASIISALSEKLHGQQIKNLNGFVSLLDIDDCVCPFLETIYYFCTIPAEERKKYFKQMYAICPLILKKTMEYFFPDEYPIKVQNEILPYLDKIILNGQTFRNGMEVIKGQYPEVSSRGVLLTIFSEMQKLYPLVEKELYSASGEWERSHALLQLSSLPLLNKFRQYVSFMEQAFVSDSSFFMFTIHPLTDNPSDNITWTEVRNPETKVKEQVLSVCRFYLHELEERLKLHEFI